MFKKLSMILILCSAGTNFVFAADTDKVEVANVEKKPNFLWLISEDNSKHFLKLYNEHGAAMPNVEKLAQHGLIFDNALSNAPVCSTARTTLATGAYGPRIGTQFHRPAQKVNLPQGLTVFSTQLKNAGYYTTNNAKLDYNFIEDSKEWDESSKKAQWQNRKPNQPFFHMQTWKDTHEHKLHFPLTDLETVATKHDPNLVELFPIYPNTELFRYTQARYLDAHQIVDKKIGEVMAKLEQEGELENTFVFYFGDHGGVLPASKGYIYERGLSVPLVVRIPKNFQHLVAQDMQNVSNKRVSGIVNFIDFGPTLLKLAGLNKATQHDGSAFIGKDISLASVNKRDTSFSYEDRMDEKYDFVRAIRVGKFKYVRRYLPHYPDALFSEYRYKQAAAVEWKDLYRQGKLNANQSAFYEPKSAEQLFNIETDPHEMNNLANEPAYKNTLVSLRTKLNVQLKSMPDLSFYPESFLAKEAFNDTEAFAHDNKSQISELIDIANMQYQPVSESKKELTTLLNSKNEWKRYWALMVLTSYGEQAAMFIPDIKALYKSELNLLNKAKAIEFLTLFNEIDTVKALTAIINQSQSDIETLEILNSANYLHDMFSLQFNPPENTTADAAKQNPWMKRWLSSRWNHLQSDSFLTPYSK